MKATISVTPHEGLNIYSLLRDKELEIRKRTSWIKTSNPRGQMKWHHKKPGAGYINIKRGKKGSADIAVRSRQEDGKLFGYVINYLMRHFASDMAEFTVQLDK